MKFMAYKIHSELAGATVWELSKVELPLSFVLEKGIYSINERFSNISLNREEEEEEDEFYFDEARPRRLGRRIRDKLFKPGILSYIRFDDVPSNKAEIFSTIGVVTSGSISGILDFAIKNLIPGNSGSQVEKIVASFKENVISESDARNRIEQIFNSDDSKICGNWPLFKIKAEELKLFQVNMPKGERILVRALGSSIAACQNYFIKAGGNKIPRCRFIVRTSDGFAAWDGARWSRFKDVKSLPAGFMSAMDRDCSVAEIRDSNFVPYCDMEPAFFLRVPCREEIKGKTGHQNFNSKGILSRPWFMMDTRCALQMPSAKTLKNIPVITDPSEALYVLRRITGRNVYIPGKPVQMRDDVLASPSKGKEIYLAGCMPVKVKK